MQIKRFPGTGLAVVALGLVALTAGCGGSSTTAQPQTTPTTVRTSTTVKTSTSVASTHTTTTTAAAGAKGSTATTSPEAAKAGPAALAALQQELDQAANSLASGGTAIDGTDVNQAKTQEGSAP